VRTQAGRATAKPDDDAIDPATLPPLESLGPDSDYTVFLKKGVPETLRIAAMRKAWMSDPFIRDFRGPAEYALDYTTSEFDLRPTDDVAKMLDRIFPPQTPAQSEPAGEAKAEPAPAPPAPPPSMGAAPASPALDAPRKEAAAPVPEAVPAAAPAAPKPRRRHGGAVPDEVD
jgi:hypothetical protein